MSQTRARNVRACACVRACVCVCRARVFLSVIFSFYAFRYTHLEKTNKKKHYMVTRYNVNFKRDKHNNKLCLLYVCLSGDRAKQMCVRVLVGWGGEETVFVWFLFVCVCV